MSEFSDKDLIELNQRGLIPGPNESEGDFAKRIAQVSSFPMIDDPSLGKPTLLKDFCAAHPMLSPKNSTQTLFDFTPDWVPVFFSNYQLFPWQGGCAWFFQLTEDGPLQACFQLRKQFAYAAKYLGIYNRDELIAHESVHIGRMLFEEPKFEEILAYRTSSLPFRRWFSPIVQSAKESFIFVLLLLASFVLEFVLLLYEVPGMMPLISAMKFLLFCYVSAGFGRLWWRQRQFDNCLAKIAEIVLPKEKALAVVFRLTDKEISDFANSSVAEIKSYIECQQLSSLRWRLIALAYIRKNN